MNVKSSLCSETTKRNDYLVIIDYYLCWIEIRQLTSLTSDCVISRVKTVFTTHGIPDVVVSDNGRQFVSDELKKFAKSWCFAQLTTNPYLLQENGMAERAVQTAKRLLDFDELEIGLNNCRHVNTKMGTSETPIKMPKRRTSDATIDDMVYANYHRYKMANQCC